MVRFFLPSHPIPHSLETLVRFRLNSLEWKPSFVQTSGHSFATQIRLVNSHSQSAWLAGSVGVRFCGQRLPAEGKSEEMLARRYRTQARGFTPTQTLTPLMISSNPVFLATEFWSRYPQCG